MAAPNLQLVKDAEHPYHLGESVFEAVCKEPKTDGVLRKVYPARFTRKLIEDMWDKQKQYRTLMGKEILSFPEFLDFFIQENQLTGDITPRGVCYVIDDLTGIFWLSDIHYPAYAEVHFTFFDGRYNGRIDLCREGIKYAFNTFAFNRLYVGVGLFAKIPLRFVESIGFKREGRLRQTMKYKGIWWDVNMYSLLREEVKQYVEIGKWR